MRAVWIWLAVAIPVLVTVLWFRLPRAPVSAEALQARKGTLLRVDTLSTGRLDDLVSQELELTSSSGLALRCLVLHPDTAGIRFPALILQGSLDRGREALHPVPKDHQPLLWAAFDYPYDLPRKRGILGYASEVPRAHRGMLDAAAGFMLLLDYLETRPDVDTSREVAAGASLGGYLAVMAGGVDERFDGVAALFCGGRLDLLVAGLLEYKTKAVRRSVAAALHPWLSNLDPVLYAPRIAPRPFILVNGAEDTMIPRECATALFEAAEEPKNQVWLDTPHRIVEDPQQLQEVVEEIRRWMEAYGFTPGAERRVNRGGARS